MRHAGVIGLLLAVPCVAIAAGVAYTVVGDNAAELARYQQERPAAERFTADIDVLAKKIGRFEQRGQVTTDQVRDIDNQLRALLSASERFPLTGAAGSSHFFVCRGAAFALREHWHVLLDRAPGDSARTIQRYRRERADCKDKFSASPPAQIILRTSAGAQKPLPGCMLILDASVDRPRYQDWSCPK